MPFSASTCITNIGTTPLGSILSAYTDFDTYVVPFTSVNINQITGSSCPYIFTNIPDGATIIKLIDPTTNCCFTIPIQSADFCSTCDLDFNYYPLETNSQILAGELTGNCFNINSYKINWFGPNSDTNVAFTSGKGSDFTYSFTHPLTGSSFIFAQAGIYKPVVDRVKISGYTFSNTGGTGTYDVNLNCFTGQTVQVLPLNCSNGNLPSGNYTHSYYFSGTGASSIPLSVTFQLSANTNYFGYSFTGVQVPDTLKITYSGSNTTPNRLLLENISIGTNNTSGAISIQNNLLNPQAVNIPKIKKLFALTGITRSDGDNLTIQLIPNSGNTEWALELKCYSGDSGTTSIFCVNSCLSQYRNSPYKIIKSTIYPLTATCYTFIQYSLSACNLSTIYQDTVYKYMYGNDLFSTNNYSIGYVNCCVTSNINNELFYGTSASSRLTFNSSNFNGFSFSPTTPSTSWCDTTNPPGTISYSKYLSGSPQVGVIDIVASNPLYINKYYQSYLNVVTLNTLWNLSACTGQPYPGYTLYGAPYYYGPLTGGTWTGGTTSINNNTDYRYYRSISIRIPTASGATQCGFDTAEGGGSGVVGWSNSATKIRQYMFHTSSPVTTGITGSNYYMRIIMNTMSYGLNLTTCQTQTTSLRSFVDFVNSTSTASTNNISYTSTTASMFSSTYLFGYSVTYENCLPVTTRTETTNFKLANFQNITMTYNPTNGNTVPQYSGSVCNDLIGTTPYSNISSNVFGGNYTANFYLGFYATVLLPTGLNPNNQGKDFIIYGKNISGYWPTDNSTLDYPNGTGWTPAYIYTAGTEQYCNPSFVIGC